jgi:hypothetical protein|tara:strand:+ start:177 stop:329 length:153 start_codon:yes stop_codon:yes gene_type:complete
MTIKLIFTESEAAKIKEDKKCADRVKSILFHKRRNDAEDRAALKAEALDD